MLVAKTLKPKTLIKVIQNLLPLRRVFIAVVSLYVFQPILFAPWWDISSIWKMGANYIIIQITSQSKQCGSFWKRNVQPQTLPDKAVTKKNRRNWQINNVYKTDMQCLVGKEMLINIPSLLSVI